MAEKLKENSLDKKPSQPERNNECSNLNVDNKKKMGNSETKNGVS